MRFSAWMMAAALLGPVVVVHAQDSRETPAYKVDFTIRDSGEAGGKAGRKYSLLVTRNVKTVFKVGNRVPVVSGGTGGVGGNSQFSYVDIGMNIEFVVGEAASKFAIHGDLDISTAIMPEKSPNAANAPTISQIKLVIDTTVVPGKPTTVASLDDPVTSRKFDLELAITKM
ncbi:MAG: hypothetical protein NTW28_20075 [Candidatus Solibacter sp.]|nr:hypothetical protein [Candidatus Solibacter sp.]